MKEQIQKLHDSNMFGIFIELGCGSPVSNALCQVPGASNTILFCENSYAKEYTQETYDIPSYVRFVSCCCVDKILSSKRIQQLKQQYPHVNTIVVSSFQLEEASSHGWIAIQKYGITTYYHLTIPPNWDREFKIEKIGEYVIRLLSGHTHNNMVDIVYTDHLEDWYEETFRFISDNEFFSFCYIKDKKLSRVEDLLRSAKDGLIIYKGSFNPITNTHIEIANQIQKKYPDYKLVFSISTNTFDKGSINEYDLTFRVNLIQKLGYDVLLFNNPYFWTMQEVLQEKGYNKSVIFPVGSDTFDRIPIEDRKELILEVVNRTNNISSTRVRSSVKQGMTDDVKECVPEQILTDVINYY